MNKVWILLPALLLLSACASKPEPECTSCNNVVIAPPPGDADLNRTQRLRPKWKL